MITQIRSWTHDARIPRLIGRKKIDWSMFEYGSTIPTEFIPFFTKANKGYELETGKGKDIILIHKSKEYSASLRSVNQKSTGREILQIRYHSKELKDLILNTFRSTYEYIQTKQQNNPDNKLIVVPDDQAEYIEFYATDIPFRYELKFFQYNKGFDQMNSPKIWWVNQGTSMSVELNEGIIWAPLTGKNGRSQYHWDTMDEVRKGDIILHYANGYLQFVSKAIEDCIQANKPSAMSNSVWNEKGRLVKVEYHPIEPKIPLEDFAQDILKLNIKQGPINSVAKVQQGYLFRLTDEALRIIQSLSLHANWPAFTQLDNENIMEVTKVIMDDSEIKGKLNNIREFISLQGFTYPDQLIENFYLSLKSKPFVILAGVSGTGKTKLVKLFAESIGATSENGQFTLIPVRPDWSDPTDLIGYKDLSGVFRPGPLAKVLVKASKPTNRNKPYFVCLDEMNLARVEHYFSDILSIIETQKWSHDHIVTDPIMTHEALDTEEDKRRYGGLYLPDNVYLIGTVNMDETTHPFSKKVLDRANTIEFNYIQLTQFPDLAAEAESSSAQGVVPNSFLRADYLQLKDVYAEYKELIERTTDKLVRINSILETIHSHVGFRIRDAICFYLIYNERFQLMSENAAFDIQLLQKILPRIQGSSLSVKRALLELLQEAIGQKLTINDYMEDATSLFAGNHELIQQAKYTQSARKLVFMIRRLEEDGFTSYWLS